MGLNHKTTNVFFDLLIPVTVNQGLTNDTDLIHVLLARIIMIGINDDKGIFQAHLFILGNSIHQIVIVVVRNIFTVFIQGTAKNGMGQWIPCCFHPLPRKRKLCLFCAA